MLLGIWDVQVQPKSVTVGLDTRIYVNIQIFFPFSCFKILMQHLNLSGEYVILLSSIFLCLQIRSHSVTICMPMTVTIDWFHEWENQRRCSVTELMKIIVHRSPTDVQPYSHVTTLNWNLQQCNQS